MIKRHSATEVWGKTTLTYAIVPCKDKHANQQVFSKSIDGVVGIQALALDCPWGPDRISTCACQRSGGTNGLLRILTTGSLCTCANAPSQ